MNSEPEPARLVRNAARCRRCDTVVESRQVHDLQFCPCKAIAVDGGLEYARRLGRREDREELSLWAAEPPPGDDPAPVDLADDFGRRLVARKGRVPRGILSSDENP